MALSAFELFWDEMRDRKIFPTTSGDVGSSRQFLNKKADTDAVAEPIQRETSRKIRSYINKPLILRKKLIEDEIGCLVRLYQLLGIDMCTFRKVVGTTIFPNRPFYEYGEKIKQMSMAINLVIEANIRHEVLIRMREYYLEKFSEFPKEDVTEELEQTIEWMKEITEV